MERRLRRLLHERIADYLSGIDRMLSAAQPPVSWPVLRERLAPLLSSWWALLDMHTPGRRGRCRQCDRWPTWHRQPCSVLRVGYAHLIAHIDGSA